MDGVAQADYFLGVMGTLAPGDLPPMIDVEQTSGMGCTTIADGVRAWADRVQAVTGRTPVIYTSIGFWNGSVCASSAVNDLTLWSAHWGVACPTIPDAWSDWVFWQYDVLPGVPGITTGDVDRDVFNGDAAALDAFANAVPVCGDGFCSGGETHATCPGDCPICEPIPPAGRIVDDTEVCAERVGGSDSWFHATDAGYGGSLWWTHAWDDPAPDNQTTWRLDFVEAGNYRVEAYTVAAYAQSRVAPYTVRHEGTDVEVMIDQAAVADGWNLIGEYHFAAGGDQYVHLRDNTGEPYASRIRIAYDAIRITRLDPPGPDADADGDGDVTEDVVADGDADADSSAEADAQAEADAAHDGDVTDAPADVVHVDSGDGCGCRATAVRPSGSLLVSLVLGACLVFRRRRASRG